MNDNWKKDHPYFLYTNSTIREAVWYRRFKNMGSGLCLSLIPNFSTY